MVVQFSGKAYLLLLPDGCCFQVCFHTILTNSFVEGSCSNTLSKPVLFILIPAINNSSPYRLLKAHQPFLRGLEFLPKLLTLYFYLSSKRNERYDIAQTSQWEEGKWKNIKGYRQESREEGQCGGVLSYLGCQFILYYPQVVLPVLWGCSPYYGRILFTTKAVIIKHVFTSAPMCCGWV